MATRIQRTTDYRSYQYLLAAAFLTAALNFVPLVRMIAYPFRLFVTFIHEGGHALASLLTFGGVESITIYANASGETYTRGGMPLFIASAGYLTSTAYGAGLLVLGRQGRNAKAALTITAALILALTAMFASDPFSWAMGIIIAIGLIFVATATSPSFAHFFLSFLAVQCCLNAIFDLDTLFWISATSNTSSDAMTMERLTLVPAIFWAGAWMVISIITLFWALRSYRWRG
jgi:hypothetical protein